MARKLSRVKRRKKSESFRALRNVAIVVSFLSVIGFLYVRSVMSNHVLDNETLCPAQPVSTTVLLVDVTDSMNLPQQQDFLNQLERLTGQIPRYGKLVVAKVDPVSQRLLTPVIVRCNPGSASDVTEMDGNPQKLERLHQKQFLEPLTAAYTQLLAVSGAAQSPIMESMQSVNLTELLKNGSDDAGRRLIVASDLLQNTKSISFYRKLPDPDALVKSQAFSRVRTDLRGTDVELWMLQRADSTTSQPRALPALWEKIIDAQGGRLVRLYTVSG